MVKPSVAYADQLKRLLRFRQSDGQIWLGEHRAVLVHAEYLRSLRRELAATLGRDRASGALFRMGFASGRADAALIRSLLADAPLIDIMRLGPEMHGLEGLVVGTVDRLDFDLTKGQFYAEASWQSSWESEEAIGEGEAAQTTCYSQTGYASGYISALLGMPVIFKEVACLSCGAAACRIVGQPAAAWGKNDPWVGLLAPDDVGTELSALNEKVAQLERRLVVQRSQGALVGVSRKFHETMNLLAKAAPTTVSILLLGETGVGKEAFAKWIHANSARADAPFVAVNCGALPETLVESELFGSEAGAYTGAKAARPGRFERANKGTIFLDELGELPLSAQVKLLRVIQEGEIERLGSTTTRKVDVRIIAATNVDIATSVAEKTFRPDLYYRLNSFPVTVAPLRERRADILPLAEAFLAKAQKRHGRSVPGFSDMAVRQLVEHAWPGNVRELENLVERSLLMSEDGEEIGVEHLGLVSIVDQVETIVGADGRLHSESDEGDWLDTSLRQIGSIEKIESALIERALQRTAGNISAAARLLGISRPALDYRIRTRGLSVTPSSD